MDFRALSYIALVLGIAACSSAHSTGPEQANAANGVSQPASPSSQPASTGRTQTAPALVPGQAEAVFAGGCFWCMEGPFEALPGVLSASSGNTDGQVAGASYDDVSGGSTGHFEAIRVVYDPQRVS